MFVNDVRCDELWCWWRCVGEGAVYKQRFDALGSATGNVIVAGECGALQFDTILFHFFLFISFFDAGYC